MSDKYNISDIVALSDQDIRDMANNDATKLRNIAEQAADKLNSRRKSVSKEIKKFFGKKTANAIPPAYKDIGLNRKIVIAKKLTTNQVAEKLIGIRNILTDATGTFSGYKHMVKKLKKGIETEARISLNDIMSNKNMAKRFWRIVQMASSKAAFTQYKYKDENDAHRYSGNKAMQNLVLRELNELGITKKELQKAIPLDYDDDTLSQGIVEMVTMKTTDEYEQQELMNSKRDDDDKVSLGRF